jgi:Flp pilus assembly protein CpaB
MKPKTMILMVVAVACGLVASYMTSRLLADRNTAPPENQVSVVFAKTGKRVPAFTPIRNPEEFFEVKQVSEGPLTAKAVKSLDELKGKRLKKAISEEAIVRTDDLQQKGEEVIEIPKGQRAIAIKVNPECLAGGFILPGMRVDILCTMRGGNDPATVLLLQNMLVMAIDMKPTRDEGQVAVLGQTATLAATPEECSRLSLAAQQGELRLTLRSQEDQKLVNLGTTKAGDLVKAVRDRDPVTGEVVDIKDDGGPSALVTPLPPTQPTPAPEPPKVVETPATPPPPKTFAMRIVEGAREQTAVFTWDDENKSWLRGPSSRTSVDEDPAPAPKPAPKPVVVPDQPKPETPPATEDSKPSRRKTK